jgi:uncharacterized protein (TIGR03083 family)
VQSLDYLAHLERESARFLVALQGAPPDTLVPTCPDWTADDLLWHLAEVQWFWGEIVRSGIDDPESYEEPARPDDRAGLEEFYRAASAGLLAALAAAEPEDPAWTWSDDKTVGFVRRRQAHEALIHRLDAELTAEARSPMDALLSCDGVDEALRVMFSGVPDWATWLPDDGSTVRIDVTDMPHTWLVSIGRFRGTSPASGTSYDDPTLEVAESDDGREVAATISGAAADVDCVLWNRPPVGTVTRSGDESVLAAFDALVAEGVQ